MWRERFGGLVDRARGSVDEVVHGDGSITTAARRRGPGPVREAPRPAPPSVPQVPDGPPPGTVEVTGDDVDKLAKDPDAIQERNLRALWNLPGGVILRLNGEVVDDPRRVLGEVQPTDSRVAYRRGSLVTTGEDVNEVLKALRELLGEGEDPADRRRDVDRPPHRLPPPSGAAAVDPAQVAERLVESSEGRLEVAVDHVVYVAQRYMFGPGSDPVPGVAASCRARAEPDPRLLVTVIDTGLYDETSPPFGAPPSPPCPTGSTTPGPSPPPTDFDKLDIDGDLALDVVAGHGSVRGHLVNQVAPAAITTSSGRQQHGRAERVRGRRAHRRLALHLKEAAGAPAEPLPRRPRAEGRRRRPDGWL